GGDGPDLQALFMATLTLKRMAEGGLYDQLGGGFCRYSVDAWWMIPHFEKMLYDNGPLLALAAQAAIATGDGLFRRVAVETAEWALRDMRSPQGGFYAALDADSEGHEGKFYAWEKAEIEALLPQDEYRAFSRRFGLDRGANFEGKWHLHCFASVEEIAEELELEPRIVAGRIDAARARLLTVRNGRVWPGRDDKVLTAWNGLMIRGLAIAGRALERPDFVDAAAAAADFIRTQCWRDGQLMAAWKDGQARFPAYLDDHAFLLDALIELMQARWRSADLAFARALADVLLERFEDRERGGFWFTAEGSETPLYRPKGFGDEAMPSGNGVAALALARLGWLLGETRYLDAAERCLRGGWSSMTRAPQGHTTALNALDEFLAPGEIVILRGDASRIATWRDALASLYAPKRLCFAIPADESGLPEALAAKAPRGEVVAYVCQGPQCSPPIDNLTRLTRWLRDGVLTSQASP
ncbi:MAG: thioredoxin domain-containing protein, partial [Steroidobacteraceae bacterium]|nr:thioredoxin domain-containing protein [Steroidobacteraceae bacterium]